MPTKAISNYLFSPTLEIPQEFPTWCVLSKFSCKTNQLLMAETLCSIQKRHKP